MKDLEKYTDSDWEKLAAKLSGEMTALPDDLEMSVEKDDIAAEKYWRELGGMNSNKEINVDRAWDNIKARISEYGTASQTIPIDRRSRLRSILSLAAAALVIIGIGSALLFLNNEGFFSKRIVISAGNSERNIEVSLPDGSKAWLNRNSRLSYEPGLGKTGRNVRLKGEAFFDIKPDASKPFIIDAGKASVKVLGTSFNVITSNYKNEVEVFVKTGKVMVSDSSGTQEICLEPGYVGIVSSASASKSINENKNYLSWKTDTLVYDGQKLEMVFADLKRVHNIDVVTGNPQILQESITTIFDNQPQDTIIRIICTTFNFSYTKDGSVYHLSK